MNLVISKRIFSYNAVHMLDQITSRMFFFFYLYHFLFETRQ
jgi:hypothetical protein